MAKKWSDVAANPAFQALSFDEQEDARRQYFEQVVAPRVTTEEVDLARGQFFSETALRRPANPVADAGGGRGFINPPMAYERQPERVIAPPPALENPGLIARMSSALPKPVDPLGIASGKPLGAPRAQEPAKAPKEPTPYRDRREALDDAVNLLEEGADQNAVRDSFAEGGIKFDEIVAHGKKRNSEYFKQQTVDAETQQRYAAPVTGEIKSTRPETPLPGADVLLAGAKGVVNGFKMLMSAGGAGGKPSSTAKKALQTADLYLEGLRSAAAVKDDEKIGQLMDRAKDGTWTEQVVAAAEAAGVAPASLVAQGLGTSVPVILATLLPGVRESTVARLAAQIGLGAVQGAGATKEAIYTAVRDDMLRTGMSKIEAEERAVAAQSYLGQNNDQIAIGMALGALASSTGVERVIPIGQVSKVLAKSGVSRAVASAEQNVVGRGLIGGMTEAVPEFLQGSAEKVAKNVALQREGRDVPTFQGAVGQGALEAIAGFGAGGLTNAAFGRPLTSDEQIAREIDAAGRSFDAVGEPGIQSISIDMLRTDPGSSNLIRPEATVVNFTPPNSATKQAGLVDIEVPMPAAPPVFPGVDPTIDQQFGLDRPSMEGPNVGASGVLGGLAATGGIGGSGVAGGSLGTAGLGDATTAGGGSGIAPGVGANDRPAVLAGGNPGQPVTGLGRPFLRSTDADLLARTELAISAQENNNANTSPAKIWAGRAGDGYVNEGDAQQALPGLQRKNPDLDWSLRKNGDGKFIWYGIPQETTLGNQTAQTAQGQAQGQGQGLPGPAAAGQGVGSSLAAGSGAPQGTGTELGLGELATGSIAQFQRPGSLATAAGAKAAGIAQPLKLAPPASLRTTGKILTRLKATTNIDAELDTTPMTEAQQAASAIARMFGKTVTFLKATTPAELPNGFVISDVSNKDIYLANDSDDAPLSVAMHEIYHLLPEPQRKALNAQLLTLFKQDNRGEFASQFKYDPKNDALIDEEIPAFMVQAISKREDFWQDLRTKMGNKEFGEVAKTIITKLSDIISGARKEYGDEFVNKYITDVVKARDLLTTAYAEALQAQGFKPDAEVAGGVMTSERSRIGMDFRDVVRRTPELQAAATKVQAGEMTAAEYDELVNAAKPVEPYKAVPPPATDGEIRTALTSDKVERIGAPSRTLKAGDAVGLRLDIPAYSNHGTWVVSVHQQEGGYNAGKSIGYEPVAAATNVNFGVVEKAALNIAGGKPKATIAVMKGNWKPTTSKQAYTAAQAALKSKDWVQVGMDPERHSYFYDRATMEPVISADEVLQVGPLVLAKKPVFGDKSDFMFSNKAQEPEIGARMARRAKTDKVGDYDVATAKDGSLTVYGDSDAIRAAMPEGTVGRVTKEGIVFTNAAAPRVRAALEGRQVAYSRGGQVTEKMPMKNGKYLGAPAKFDTPGKIPTLRKMLSQLAEEGAPGRYWYENSSREVLKMVGGDVSEARKFVALLAIYSPQAKVDANSTFALRAWAQYKAGQTISVKTGVMDAKAKKAMDNVDEFWSGEKTGNFFFNLLREIDPTTEGKQGATIDMWMMRAGQYDTDAPTGTQYSFMENETNRLAQELGWEPQQVQAAIWVAMKARMENSGVKKMTEASSEKKGWIRYDYPLKNGKPFKTRVIIDAQKHRDNWLKYSFAHDVTKDDTQQAKFDFGDGLKRHIGQVSFEARPGRTSGVLPGIHSAPYAQQIEFQQAVQKAFLNDNGTDELASYLGLLVDSDILAPGVWQGEISPSTQLGVAMAPAKGEEGKTNVDPAQAKALNIYASVAGLVARQEGVGWHRPFYASTKRDANGLDINAGRVLNPREVADLEAAVGQWMADNRKAGWQDKFAFVSSPSGIRIVNFGIITNDMLQTAIVEVAQSVLPDFDYRVFASSGDMPTNNWKESPNGESYVQRVGAEGRSDVLDWARSVLAPRVQRVFEQFAEKYHWGDPGQIQFSNRAVDGGDGGGRNQGAGVADRQAVSRRPEDSGRDAGQNQDRSQDLTPLPGAPKVPGYHGPDPRLVAVAEQYARDNGITLRRQAEYVQVDPKRAARIAAAYEDMPHAPQDLRVKAAYKELIAQTLAQYRALEKAGYRFWFIDVDQPSNAEYASTPWNAMRDLRANKQMGVFPTAAGYGSAESSTDGQGNLMEANTGLQWPFGSLDGPLQPVLANDLFRAVHDAFGHGLEGAGFREHGEENAWQAHVRLFTGSAVGAITSETRGQNSWLNYGPYGEMNRTAKVEDTVFADQKTGLMPKWTWTEGVAGDMGDEVIASNRALEDRERQSKKMLSDGDVFEDIAAPDTPAFKRWSKGLPIYETLEDGGNRGIYKVYHATPASFGEFIPGGKNPKDSGKAIWVSTSKTYQAAVFRVGSEAYGFDDGANVMPLYARLERPMLIDDWTMLEWSRSVYGSEFPQIITDKALAAIREDGYDSVIFNGDAVFDGSALKQGKTDNEILVFSPNQLKSAIGNNGAFDLGNPDITASNRRQRLSVIGSNYTLPTPSMTDDARRALQDDALRMQRVIEAVRSQGGVVTEKTNFYDANTLMPGRIQAAMDDFRERVMQPLIDKATKYNIDFDELALYAYAKHAEERNRYIASINPRMPDGGSGMKTADADAILQQVASGSKAQQFEELHRDLMAITSTTRQIMLVENLITQDEFDALDGQYQSYIPLRGLENVDSEGRMRPGVGRGVNVRGKETVRALGRRSRASDLIENVIRDYERAVMRIEKNDVGKVLLDFVLSNPDPDLWGVDVERNKPVFNKATGVVQYTKQIEKGEDTIGVKVEGQQVYIKLADADLARALRQAWKDETSGMERATLAMTGWWNNWMRAVLTRYNPAFAVINIPRDALWSGTASALAELGSSGLAKYLAVYPQAFMASVRREAGVSGTNSRLFGNVRMDARFAEFRSAGGITGGFFMRSLDDINKDLRNDLLMAGAAPRNPWESIKSMPPMKLAKLTLKMLEFMGSASENATRFALYQAARESGRTPAKAAILAKDGTTNFNRKGEWGGALNNLYLFFNAGVQGTTQLAKVLKSPAVMASMAGVTGVGMMLAFYGAASGGEDEDKESYWDKIPSFVKERNIVIMLPPGDALAGGIERVGKRGRYVTIPVQYGFNIFPNLGYVMADLIRNQKDPKRGMTPTKGALHMTSTVFGSVNPFGGSVDVSDGVQVLLAAMPTLVDLPIQLVNERNTFGSPSSPSKSPFDMRPDSERMFTSQQESVSAKIAKTLNELGGGNAAKEGSLMGVNTSVAPGTIQTLIGATTGGLGTFIEQTGTAVISMTGDDKNLKSNKIPFLNKFYGEVDEGANIQKAEERSAMVRKLSSEVKAQEKIGITPDLTAEEKRIVEMANSQNSYQDQMRNLRKREIEIIKDEKKTDAQKRLDRRKIQIDRDKLATDLNEEYLKTVPRSAQAANSPAATP